ncbi:MAG: hypothetical protein V4739_11690, partial [Pseudomonadota bacterium]
SSGDPRVGKRHVQGERGQKKTGTKAVALPIPQRLISFCSDNQPVLVCPDSLQKDSTWPSISTVPSPGKRCV